MSTLRSALGHLIGARRLWQLCLGAGVLAVAWLTLTPTPPPSLTTGWDKLNHAVGFAALAWSASLAFSAPRVRVWPVVFALLAFGGAIELLQLLVPGRSGEWGDLLADGLGTALGVALASSLAAAAETAGPVDATA